MNASYRQGQCLATTLVAAALLACGPTVADEPTARRNAVRLLGAESYEVACVTEIRGGHLVALKIRTAPDMVSHDLEWRPVVVVDSLGTVRSLQRTSEVPLRINPSSDPTVKSRDADLEGSGDLSRYVVHCAYPVRGGLVIDIVAESTVVESATVHRFTLEVRGNRSVDLYVLK